MSFSMKTVVLPGPSEPSYINCLPSALKIGQIVEAQVAFCAVPIGKGKYRLICKLRALCILDRQVQKVVAC